MSRLRVPTRTGRAALLTGGLSWIGAAIGWSWGTVGFAAGVAIGVLLGFAANRWVAAAVIVAAAVSGWSAAARVEATLNATLVEGPITIAGFVADEPVGGSFGERFVLRPEWVQDGLAWEPADLPPLAVGGADSVADLTAGDRVVVRGVLAAAPGRVRDDPVAGRFSRASVTRVSGSSHPLFVVGNALRRRVGGTLSDRSEERAAALLSGFLIGDVSRLRAQDSTALRRAGLTHFVAVSGSNVALFLAGWWLVTAPLATRATRCC